MESGVDVFYPEGLRGARLPEVRVVITPRRRSRGCRQSRVARRRCHHYLVFCNCFATLPYDPADDEVEDPFELTDDDWRWARRCAAMALPERQNALPEHGSRAWWRECCRF